MANIQINKKYQPADESNKRYKHFCGGRGGARSYTAAQRQLLKTYGKEYYRGLIIRQHYSDVRSSQFQLLKDLIAQHELGGHFAIRENTMEVENLTTGHKIISKGFRSSNGDAKAKLKSLTDITDVWIEEATEVGWNDFNKLDDSIRTTKGSSNEILFTYNQDDAKHWLKTKFHDVERDDTLYVHTTYMDNRANLSESLLRKYDKLRLEDPDSEYVKVNVLGKWGAGSKGLIYPKIEIVGEVPESFKWQVYGLDFGYTNDPTALIQVTYSEGSIYLKQMIYDYGLTNSDILKEMERQGIDRSALIIADSAEPKSIEDIRIGIKDGAGSYLYQGYPSIKAVKKGADSVVNGIDIVNRQQLKVVGSKDVQDECRNYKWKLDRSDEPTNVPEDKYNHAMDAVRYVCMHKFSNSGQIYGFASL